MDIDIILVAPPSEPTTPWGAAREILRREARQPGSWLPYSVEGTAE